MKATKPAVPTGFTGRWDFGVTDDRGRAVGFRYEVWFGEDDKWHGKTFVLRTDSTTGKTAENEGKPIADPTSAGVLRVVNERCEYHRKHFKRRAVTRDQRAAAVRKAFNP
jgi:hypothetical protein